MTTFWNERYSADEYVYGEQPNEWFKHQIDAMKPGKILLPGDGEGRNGVYAASLGWEVYAFDLSVAGKEKAIKLAKKHNVKIDYRVGDLAELPYEENSFDVIALVYTHFAPGLRKRYHKKLDNYLKPGGKFLIEGFRKEQIQRQKPGEKGGGPKKIEMLYSENELRNDFLNYEIKELDNVEVELNEGRFHNGNNAVIRFVGKKVG